VEEGGEHIIGFISWALSLSLSLSLLMQRTLFQRTKEGVGGPSEAKMNPR